MQTNDFKLIIFLTWHTTDEIPIYGYDILMNSEANLVLVRMWMMSSLVSSSSSSAKLTFKRVEEPDTTCQIAKNDMKKMNKQIDTLLQQNM